MKFSGMLFCIKQFISFCDANGIIVKFHSPSLSGSMRKCFFGRGPHDAEPKPAT